MVTFFEENLRVQAWYCGYRDYRSLACRLCTLTAVTECDASCRTDLGWNVCL